MYKIFAEPIKYFVVMIKSLKAEKIFSLRFFHVLRKIFTSNKQKYSMFSKPNV